MSRYLTLLVLLLVSLFTANMAFLHGKFLSVKAPIKIHRLTRQRVPTILQIAMTKLKCMQPQTDEPVDTNEEVMNDMEIDEEADHLMQSISDWLDVEYVPHSANHLFATKVRRVFVQHLVEGILNIDLLHEQIQCALDTVELKDTHIDTGDVADKACEMVMERFDLVEEDEHIDLADRVRELNQKLRPEFGRYQFLRFWMEGSISREELDLVIATQLGFRLHPHTNTTTHPTIHTTDTTQSTHTTDTTHTDSVYWVQDPELAHVRWEHLSAVPNFTDLSDLHMQARIDADMPEDPDSVDIVMESLVGHLAYSEMKASTDPHLQRRILIAKWIYIHGFLNIHFPPTRRYTPAHFEVEERKNAI